MLRVDEKNLREYSVLNVCGVVITTNHKTDGIYLPADDRRHYVAWSRLTKDDFDAEYWNEALALVRPAAAIGMSRPISPRSISPDSIPRRRRRKTHAFWDIVDASRAPEDAELADVLDKLRQPGRRVTLAAAHNAADDGEGELRRLAQDRKNRRADPAPLGAVRLRPGPQRRRPKDGLWKIKGKRQAIYASALLPRRDQLAAAGELAAGKRWDGKQWSR